MMLTLKHFIRTNHLLISVLVIAAFLRFYGLRWDSGFPTHPDERDIIIAASRVEFFSNLNPKFFTYGGLPIYLISAGAQLAMWNGNLYRIHLISRALSAFASTASVVLIYLIARRLFGKEVGLLASLLAAFSPGFIQYAHFGVADSLVIFLLLGIFWLSLEFLDKPSVKKAAITGCILGLAIGTKIQSLMFSLIPLAVLILSYKKRIIAKPFLKSTLTFFVSALICFIAVNPFLFSERKLFLDEVGLAAAIARGDKLTHFTLQFIGANPIIFNIKNILWLLGPVSLFGFIFFARYFITKPKKDGKLLVFVLFPLIYFLYINTWHAKFIRYMLSVVPFVLVAASKVLLDIKRKNDVAGNILVIVSSGTTVFYGLAFFTLYIYPMTTYSASEWIFRNVPKDSTIVTEALDLKLPLPIEGQDPLKYKIVELPMYEKDSQVKIEFLVDNLADADYLILSSPRFWENIPRDPEGYPVSAKYYSAIFDERLGYEKVAEFNRHPSLFGIQINDDNSEETFKVFEHPRVLIFKNIGKFSNDKILSVLLSN